MTLSRPIVIFAALAASVTMGYAWLTRDHVLLGQKVDANCAVQLRWQRAPFSLMSINADLVEVDSGGDVLSRHRVFANRDSAGDILDRTLGIQIAARQVTLLRRDASPARFPVVCPAH